MFKKISLLLSCVLLVAIESFAQSKTELDSLFKVLKEQKMGKDSAIVDLLNVLGKEYRGISMDSSDLYLEKAETLASEINYQRGLAQTYIFQGGNEIRKGNYVKALELLFVAREVYTDISDLEGVMSSLKNISIVYYEIKDYSKAANYSKEALIVGESVENRQLLGGVLNTLGGIYQVNNKLDSAAFYYKRYLEISKEQSYTRGISIALNNLGNVYSGRETDLALHYYEEALRIDRETGADPYGMCSTLDNIASLNIKLGNYEKAKKYVNESIFLAKENGFKQELSNAYKYLDRILKAKGQYEKAYENLIKKVTVDNELLNKEKNEALEEMSSKYESEKKEQEIERLNQKSAIQALELTRKNQNFIILGILLLFIILIFGFIYKQRQDTLKHRAQVIEQKLLRTQMNPHFIFNAMAAIQDYMVAADSAKAADYLAEFSTMIRQVLDNSRNEFIRLDQEINMLENYLSLQNLVRKVPFNYSIHFGEGMDPEEIAIPPMFAQPFVENAVEHGFRGKGEDAAIDIHLHLENNHLVLKVLDNGEGLKKVKCEQTNHKSQAIQITNERIELFKKMFKKEISFDLLPGESGGTSVVFNLPFKYV